MKLHVFRISNGAADIANGKLPPRIKLLDWGDNPAIAGLNPKVGRTTLATFFSRMTAKGFDEVALDFEHNTVEGTPEFERTREPRPVAAFGVPALVEGEGLFLDNLRYTPHGREFALSYIDLSPTVHLDPASGEVDFLHSVALTRAGAVTGLSFYSIEANVQAKPQGKKEEEMDWKAFIAAITGAKADATDEELQSAFEQRMQALAAEAANPVREELTTLSATVTALAPGDGSGHEGELTALSTTVATLKDELTALSGELVAMRRRGICEQAAREGKVIPLSAEQIAAMAPETLGEMVSKLPVTVPVDRRTPEHIQALSAAAASSALKTVATTCGMDPARVAEVNKAS